jgi:hypothetical protein
MNNNLEKGGGGSNCPFLCPIACLLENYLIRQAKKRGRGTHTIGDVGDVALSRGTAECGTIES